ncbi:hypothetical protein H4F20_04245 [Vibrio sp. 16]|uniref:hypothetical protein n=1 Tax=Vibrio sp. 16 TaxID=391586 RepID=UPI002FF0CD7E
MKRIWLAVLFSVVLSGCVVFPTTRDYYKPVVMQSQSAVPSSACGYVKTRLDGIEQATDHYGVSVFPSKDSENGISITALLESKRKGPELVNVEVVTEIGALMRDDHATQVSNTTDSVGIHRSWFNVKYPPLKVLPEQLKIMVTDSEGKTYEFNFEHTIQSDVYHGSINC